MATLAPRTTTFAVRGPISRAELPGLCARICRLFEREQPEIAYCDVERVAVDAVTVEALARLQLGAQRNGCRVLLRHASADLVDLVALMGLGDVLPEEG
jgi:ABC-type transporter Mla MlaB component